MPSQANSPFDSTRTPEEDATAPVLVAPAEEDAKVLVALVVGPMPWFDEVLLDVDVDVDELDEEVDVVVPLALDARPATNQSKDYIKALGTCRGGLPTREASASNTVYTFFRNTSPNKKAPATASRP